MKNYRYYITIAVVALILPMLTSCRQELCYNHYPSIAVSLSWEYEWERDYGMHHLANWDTGYHGFGYDDLRPEKPEWVKFVKYSNEGRPDERLLSPNGGNIILDSNPNKSFLLYNGDTEYIVLSDMVSLPDARASATGRSRASISYVTERHPNTRSTNPPDILYSAYVEKAPAVAVHEQKQMPIKMQPLVYTYLIRYEFEYGLQHVALARGALGGMAESVYLRNGTTSEESSIILFDCSITDYGCEARVRSFGAPGFPDEYYGRSTTEPKERLYTLNLEVMLKNGKTVEFNYDISDQLTNQPRGGVIKVGGLRIEDKQNMSDSGFDVDVTSWGNHQDIDLPVGLTK